VSPAGILTVAGREFRSFFDQATAYILLVVFLVANFFFLFRAALATAEASLRPMFDLMPWLLLFFVPAVTMRSIAEDRATGIDELVLAQPIYELDYLLGKFVGILGFLGVALAGTVPAWFALDAGGSPLVGPAVAQYAGTLLLCAAFVAIGLWASATTRNQITAFILAVTVIFVLIGLTLPVVLIGLSPSLGAAAQRLGVISHYRNITRGVLDLRDVVYFVSLAIVFLGLAWMVLLRARRNASGRAFRTLQVGVLGLIAIAVVANLFGQFIRGRWDLAARRDRVARHLAEHEIASAVFYPIPLHLQPLYAALGGQAGGLPVAERAAHEVLSLPLYPEMTAAQVDRVAGAVLEALRS